MHHVTRQSVLLRLLRPLEVYQSRESDEPLSAVDEGIVGWRMDRVGETGGGFELVKYDRWAIGKI